MTESSERPAAARPIDDDRDVLRRPAPPPDAVIAYGEHPEQVADLRLPAVDPTQVPVPVIVVLHGGFWRQEWDRTHIGPLSAALAARGWAVLTPEYRRTGGDGGWPATFDDVALAVDRLPGLAEIAARRREVDLDPRVTLLGHSAGGHLALWSAARHRLAAGTPWHREDAGAVTGVVALAPVAGLATAVIDRLDGGAAELLVGGDPTTRPERFAQADPMSLLPTGVPTVLVHGADDDVVASSMSVHFADEARSAGDSPDLRVVRGLGHWGFIDPLSEDVEETYGALESLPR